MNTQHALSLARQRQADLRRGAPTARIVGSQRGLAFAGAARLAKRKRTIGWLLVEVGLQLAVDKGEPCGEQHPAAGSATRTAA